MLELPGWCVTIPSKPQGHVEVEHIQDELSYRAYEVPSVLPMTTIIRQKS